QPGAIPPDPRSTGRQHRGSRCRSSRSRSPGAHGVHCRGADRDVSSAGPPARPTRREDGPVKILVIGTGLIGGAAVSALSERGHDVVEASRSSSPAVDATDPESIAALFSAVGPVDAVVPAVGSGAYEPH